MYKSKKPRHGIVLITSYWPSKMQGSIRIYNLSWGKYLSPEIKIHNVKDKETLIERGILIALLRMWECKINFKIYCTDKAFNNRIGSDHSIRKKTVSFPNLTTHLNHLLSDGYDNCMAYWQSHWGSVKAEVLSTLKKEPGFEFDLPF